jgi:hypothetical protein
MIRSTSSPRLGVAAALIAVLAVVIYGLHGAARFDLGGPSSWSLDGLRTWGEDPLLVVATVARWVALGLAYYLAAVLAALAVTGDSEKVGRVVPRSWIGPLAAMLGIGVVVVSATGSTDRAPSAVSAPLTLRSTSAALVLEPDPPLAIPTSPRTSLTPTPTPDELGPEQPAPAPTANDVVTVTGGDSFWSLACESLAESWGRPVTDAEIVPFWRTMIEANIDRLVEPGNPDLILPGQELRIPEVPPDPSG